jgi:phenylacetate-CoA ligase
MDSERPRRVLAELQSFLAAEPASAEDPRKQVVADRQRRLGAEYPGVGGAVQRGRVVARIRRFLAARPEAAGELFGEARLPTLVQYDPGSRFFETRDGTLLFSADNGIPLLRYHIADEGGLIGYQDMLAFCGRHGFDPIAELGGPGARGVRPLPFAYVFGRSYFTVSYFGANVYPENVTVGLEQPAVSGWVTGKFVLEVADDADGNPHLTVAVELAPGESADATRERVLAESIRAQLQRLNSEFAHYVPASYQLPDVTLRPAGDPEYFPAGVKHRYTRGSSNR